MDLINDNIQMELQASAPKIRRKENPICCICNEGEQRVKFVKNPNDESRKTFSDRIHRRAKFLEPKYMSAQQQLEGCNVLDLNYHRKCYQNAINPDQLKRAETNYNKMMKNENGSDNSKIVQTMTRSSISPFDKELCLFCQENLDSVKLHNCETENMGTKIRNCIVDFPELEVRMNSAINMNDATAMDLKYHLVCYSRQRRKSYAHYMNASIQSSEDVALVSAEYEFIRMIESNLRTGKTMTMAECEDFFINTFAQYNLDAKSKWKYVRYRVRKILLEQIDNIIITNNQGNMPGIVSLDCSKGEEIEPTNEIETLMDAALILRRRILLFKQEHKVETFEGSLIPSISDIDPLSYMFFKVLIAGKPSGKKLVTQCRQDNVNVAAINLSLNTSLAIKSDRQAYYTPKHQTSDFRNTDTGNKLAISAGLAIRKYTRSKKIVEMLSKLHVSLPNTSLLAIETSLANSVIHQLAMHPSGKCLFDFFVKGQIAYFHIDNVDFTIDTQDGKHQLHGLLIVLFQRQVTKSKTYSLKANLYSDSLTIDELEFTKIKDYTEPNFRRDSVMPPEIGTQQGIMDTTHLKQIQESILPWKILKGSSEQHRNIPPLAGYQSLIQDQPKFLTNIAPLPVIDKPVHHWDTLYTSLMLAKGLNDEAVGGSRKTTITLDLALYEKMLKIVLSDPNLQNQFNLRLGELHIEKAHLLCLSGLIRDSGYDLLWADADVYGPETSKDLLNAGHIDRGLQAHQDTLIALYQLMIEEIINKNPDFKKQMESIGTYSIDNPDECKKVHKSLQAIDMQTVLDSFKDSRKDNVNAQFAFKYMAMIERGINFNFASRNRDWLGHLETSNALCKDIFAFNRIKYMRLLPFYIRSQYALENSDPLTWQSMLEGDCSVTTKNIPFVSLGPDHAGEQQNKVIKGEGGITGIANNTNARNRYFITAPIISQLVNEYEDFLNLSTGQCKHHHLIPSVLRDQADRTAKIKNALKKNFNPFAEESDPNLRNIITHKVLPPSSVHQILNSDVHGEQLHQEFVKKRFIDKSEGIWDKVSKAKVATFSCPNPSAKKKGKISSFDCLSQERDILGRILIMSQSREINKRELISIYELTKYPQSLFQGDQLLRCNDKSMLASVLISISQNQFRYLLKYIDHDNSEDDEWEVESAHSFSTVSSLDEHDLLLEVEIADLILENDLIPSVKKCLCIDGMGVVHLIKDDGQINTISDFAKRYDDLIIKKAHLYDEIRIIFDPYLSDSLKSSTREHRNNDVIATHYAISDSLSIKRIGLKKLLAHDLTKRELGVYLAKKFILKHEKDMCIYVTSFIDNSEYSSVTLSNASGSIKEVDELAMNHDEADTMLIMHGIHFSANVPQNSIVHVWSSDTDVFSLLIHYSPYLLSNTFLFWGVNVYDITGLVSGLGVRKAKAFLGLHSITGCDTVGRLAYKSKETWLNHFLNLDLETDSDILNALEYFGDAHDISKEHENVLCRFIATCYAPNTSSLGEARWALFSKNLTRGPRLPPTLGAFQQHLRRALAQAFTWKHSNQAMMPKLDLKVGIYGWKWGPEPGTKKEDWIPIASSIPPAPDSVTELISCNCKGACTTNKCMCFKNKLICTNLCHIKLEISCCENSDSITINGVSDLDGPDFDCRQ